MKENIIFTKYFWAIETIIAIFILFAVTFLLKFFVKILKTKTFFKQSKWKNKLDYLILKPAYFLIWSLGIIYLINIFSFQLDLENVLKYTTPIRNAIIVFFISWLLFRWKKIMQSILKKKETKGKFFDFVTLELISKIGSFIIFFLAFLLILQIFGVNIMPLIAFGGVGAAAIGFAAKDVIANFFGGFMIHITRPFIVGDFIEIPKENILGTIEKIGWYLTAIKDLDSCLIYVPNAVFSTAQIKNKSRRTHRKIEETIGIRYDDFSKINSIILDIKNLLNEDEKIDGENSPIVSFTAFNDYSLDLFIRAYTYPLSYQEFMYFRQDLLIKIQDIIKNNKADIPFPTTTVYLQKEKT